MPPRWARSLSGMALLRKSSESPPPREPGAGELAKRSHRVRQEHLEQWRSAARDVARAWEVWLASDDAERDWAHQVYLEALAREEQAAAHLEEDARTFDGRGS